MGTEHIDSKPEKKVLILTWGSPWSAYSVNKDLIQYRWSEVNYVIDEGGNLKCKSRTTLPVVYKHYSPDKIIIIATDTTIFNPDLFTSENRNYRDLIQYVEKIYGEFIQDIIESSANKCDINIDEFKKKIEIVIAPGTGTYNNRYYTTEKREESLNINFCGSITNYYNFIYGRLSELLYNEVISLLKDSKQPKKTKTLRIILDLTHGVNYMPALTYRAIKDLGGAASILLRPVFLEILNSEPYTQGVNELRIHLVEKTLNPRPERFSFMNGKEPLEIEGRCLSKHCEETIRELLSNRLSKIKELIDLKDVYAYASSIENGLPLLLLYTFPRASLSNVVSSLENIFYDFTTVEKDFEVKHHVRYTPNASGIFKALFIADALRNAYNISRREEISLKELKEITGKIIWIDNATKLRISHELHTISRIVESRGECDNNYRKLSEYLQYEDCDYIEKEEDRFRRNLLSHAGLERCVTEIRCLPPEPGKTDLEIYVRYVNDKLEHIRKSALKLIS